MSSYYPEVVIAHLRKIKQKRKQGRNYPAIAKELQAQTDAVFKLTERVRQEFEAEKEARRLLRTALSSKGIDMVLKAKTGEVTIVEAKMGSLRQEVGVFFRRWDGEVSDGLRRAVAQVQEYVKLHSVKDILGTLGR